MTTVISVRWRNRDELLADPAFQYVGRKCAGWSASIWANPFKRGMTPREAGRIITNATAAKAIFTEADRDEVMTDTDLIECFEAWLKWQSGLMPRLPELRDKTLGCWCGKFPKNPDLLCHAASLARLANGLPA